LQLLPTGLGGKGRRCLDVFMPKPARWWRVMLVVWVYYSGMFVWRYYMLFPISYLPNGLEKILSSHPPGWALLWCSKPSVATTTAAAVIR
jgi:hypothetical protein